METNIALTVIGCVLTLLGVGKILVPEQFNQRLMGNLHAEAVNPAAAIRAALGGAILVTGIVALMCRNLPANEAGTLLQAMGIGFIVLMASIASNKLRGYSHHVPVPPMVIFTVLVIIAFTAT